MRDRGSPPFSSMLPSRVRPGATLIEVLMSLLIMSIGIGMVFGLFPLAILSSIRATQLTNSVILQDNVRQLVHTIPQLLEPPFGDPWDSTLTWKGQWQPRTHYKPGDIVMPRLEPGELAPSPYFALQCTTEGDSASVVSDEPAWNAGTNGPYTESSGLQWQALDFPNYVVDPIGYYRTLIANPMNSVFGNRDLAGDTSSILGRVPRRAHVPAASQITSEILFSSPDSWNVIFQSVPTSVSGNTLIFPGDTDLAGIIQSNPLLTAVMTRVILTTPDGDQTIIRTPAAATTGNTLVLTQPVPSAFTGNVRIESFSRRYSFFLTVRSNGREISPSVSSAVVFNRQSSADTEYIYPANFGNPTFNAEPSVTDSSLLADQVKISWNPGSDAEPNLKTGNWIMDARSLLFYRIKSITKGSGEAKLTLDRYVAQPTFNANGVGYAMIMPGIIMVNPINYNE